MSAVSASNNNNNNNNNNVASNQAENNNNNSESAAFNPVRLANLIDQVVANNSAAVPSLGVQHVVDDEEVAAEIEARVKQFLRRRPPMLRRQIIRVPGPAPKVQQVVKRLPTPEPDVIERVYVQVPQRDLVNLLIERPATPQPEVKQRTIVKPNRRPLIQQQIVTVQPHSVNNQLRGVAYQYQPQLDSALSYDLSSQSVVLSQNVAYAYPQNVAYAYPQNYFYVLPQQVPQQQQVPAVSQQQQAPTASQQQRNYSFFNPKRWSQQQPQQQQQPVVVDNQYWQQNAQPVWNA